MLQAVKVGEQCNSLVIGAADLKVRLGLALIEVAKPLGVAHELLHAVVATIVVHQQAGRQRERAALAFQAAELRQANDLEELIERSQPSRQAHECGSLGGFVAHAGVHQAMLARREELHYLVHITAEVRMLKAVRARRLLRLAEEDLEACGGPSRGDCTLAHRTHEPRPCAAPRRAAKQRVRALRKIEAALVVAGRRSARRRGLGARGAEPYDAASASLHERVAALHLRCNHRRAAARPNAHARHRVR
mmetsp:Transcript_15258/g.63380  ORF Transcript_15258/g.63380 Transcript_15258/m.63380 type:complete len:248 (+) Transcript_15258:1926-2669(+)